MSRIIREETSIDLFGLYARAFAVVASENGRIVNQKILVNVEIGPRERLTVKLRFDDEYRNGHETFAITGTLRNTRLVGDRGIISCGCLHDEIAQHVPKLAHLIKWHLTSINGPMHYLANTIYHAGDHDHNGLRAGERRQIRNGKTGQLAWKLEDVPAKYLDSNEPPPPVTLNYVPWEIVGEGKVRDLAAARRAAVWPDAPDEILMSEPEVLKAALEERLPALMVEFKRDMLACGFLWARSRV